MHVHRNFLSFAVSLFTSQKVNGKRLTILLLQSSIEKRWRLVHLSIVLSARKPVLSVLSTGANIVEIWLSLCIVVSFFLRCITVVISFSLIGQVHGQDSRLKRHLAEILGLADIAFTFNNGW